MQWYQKEMASSSTSLIKEFQPEHVGPRIVPAWVELHAAGRDGVHVQFRVSNALAVPKRLRNIVAVGVDYAAPAPADRLRQGLDGGAARAAIPGTCPRVKYISQFMK